MPYGDPDPQLLTAEVQAEYVRRYGGEGDTSPIDTTEFAGEGGHFVVVYVDDVPAAMGGWRRGGKLDWSVAEIKRMFVRPQFARRGLARQVLAELERTAAEQGVERFVLETGTAQPEAIALYRSCGYEDVPAFGFYADYDDSVHLGKVLAPVGDDSSFVAVEESSIDDRRARQLLEELQAEYVRRWGHVDEEPSEAADFSAPRGRFFLALLDGEAVGTGGWRRDGGVAEIKRMYVRPSAQRRGVARALLAAIESSAAADGLASAVLVTGELQPEATALYRSSGYRDIAPFGVYTEGPTATFLGKSLSGPAT